MRASPLSARNRDLVGKLIKLGVFAVVSIILTIVVVASLLDLQTAPSRTYKAHFSDSSGLQGGDPVRIAGVKVGRVTSVKLDGATAMVTFNVASSQKLVQSTRAQIHYESLLGQRNLTLLNGTGSQQPLRKGQLIPMSQTTPALDLSDLFNGFQPLYSALAPDQVNELTANIIGAFQGEGDHISALITQAAGLTTNLANRTQVIDQVLDNLTQLLGVVGNNDQQLGQLIDGFQQLSGTVAGERNLIGDALGNTSQMVTSLNGMLSAAVPPLQQSVAGLDTSLAAVATNQNALDALLRQLPPTTSNLVKTLQNGSYANVYICELAFNTTAPVQELPIPVYQAFDNQIGPQLPPPLNSIVTNATVDYSSVAVHSGAVGSNNIHTPICRH